MEAEPSLADKRVGVALRIGELGEDPEEDFVGEEEGPVDFREIRYLGFGFGVFWRREGVEFHGVDYVFERVGVLDPDV